MKKNKPFFSIIIPTLNEEKYLPKLLDCLKKQIFNSFEVFVVDGTSKDKTKNIVKKYQKSLKNLKLISSGKNNVSFQRNLGAEKAKGKYLIFIDADVIFNKKAFSTLYSFIKKSKPDMFITKFSFSSEKNIYKILAFLTNFLFFIFEKLKRSLGFGFFLGMKKEVFKHAGGFNPRLVFSEEHNLIKKARKLNYNFFRVKSLTIATSPRRPEKKGLIRFLFKYLYITIYEQIKGPFYKRPFEYQMGGD